MASVRTAENVIEAMRLVAAARIHASRNAALAARPFADRLQLQLGNLVANIRESGTDVAGVAAAARHDAFVVLAQRSLTVDRLAQRALMDKLYLTLLDVSREGGERLGRAAPNSSLQELADAAPPPPPADAAATVTLLVVFSSDRGFCGSYNKDVLSRAVRRIHAIEVSHPSRTVELVLVGKAASTFFAKRYPHLPVRFSTETGPPMAGADTTARVCDAVLSLFISGDLERVEVVYTRFTSLVSNMPSVRTLLPVTPSGLEVPDDEIFQLTSRNGKLFVAPKPENTPSTVGDAAVLERRLSQERPPYYDMSEEASILLLNAMLPMYVHSQLTRMLRDSVAAELSCRMNAMNAAADNCRDISKSLKAKYNRERQTQITQEVRLRSACSVAPLRWYTEVSADMRLLFFSSFLFSLGDYGQFSARVVHEVWLQG